MLDSTSIYRMELRIGDSSINILLGERGFTWTTPILQSEEQATRAGIMSPKRRAEFELVRFLKHQIFPTSLIEYNNLGRPRLHNRDECIGISHSSNLGLFGYSGVEFGCDLEIKQDRFLLIGSRYTSKEDADLLNNLEERDRYAVLWVCKEAIYKLINIKGVHWRDECRLHKVQFPLCEFIVQTANYRKKVFCHVEEYESKAWFALAYHKNDA